MFFKIIKIFFLFFAMSLFASNYKWDKRIPYGYQGVWSERGLVANFTIGSFHKLHCSANLTQWRGGLQYQPHPDYSWGGQVEVIGGSLDEEQSLSTTRYLGNVRFYKPKKHSVMYYGFTLGVDKTELSSLVFEEELRDDPRCADFKKDLGAGVLLNGGGGVILRSWLVYTYAANIGMTYSLGFLNEIFTGIAIDVHEMFKDSWQEVGSFVFYAQVMGRFDENEVQWMGVGGVSLGF